MKKTTTKAKMKKIMRRVMMMMMKRRRRRGKMMRARALMKTSAMTVMTAGRQSLMRNCLNLASHCELPSVKFWLAAFTVSSCKF